MSLQTQLFKKVLLNTCPGKFHTHTRKAYGCKFTKRDIPLQVFSCKFCGIFRDNYSVDDL